MLHMEKHQRRYFGDGKEIIILAGTLMILTLALSVCARVKSLRGDVPPPEWQENFSILDRKLSDIGESRYFILKPGFKMILESQFEKLTITVLDETKVINGITTRVLEEREERNGELIEISRNYHAIDPGTGDVFYFGEEVDIYSQGQITGHSGAWIAYDDQNRPGLIMAGTPVVGMKYYQEVAPGVAMDRAKVVSVSETFTTIAGEFENCLVTQESSQINPAAIEYKTYCPGIGLVQDQSLVLTSYGNE